MENESLPKDLNVLNYLGKSYLKMSRVILERQFSPLQSEREIGLVHNALFCFCNYADGFVDVEGHLELCGKGELITTYSELSTRIGISRGKLRRCVNSLVEDGLLKTKRVGRWTSFHVCGYIAFVEPKDITFQKNDTSSATVLQAQEELRLFGDKKPHTDLLPY